MLSQKHRMENMEVNRAREKTNLRRRKEASGSQTCWLILQIFRDCCSEAKRKEVYSYFAEINYSCYITFRREDKLIFWLAVKRLQHKIKSALLLGKLARRRVAHQHMIRPKSCCIPKVLEANRCKISFLCPGHPDLIA